MSVLLRTAFGVLVIDRFPLSLGAAELLGRLHPDEAALARTWGPPPVRFAATTYVEAVRNTPLLIQLFLVFFGLPSAKGKKDSEAHQ